MYRGLQTLWATGRGAEQIQSFERRKDFLGLTEQDERALQSLHTAFGEGAPGFVDGFYRHLLSFPEMRVLIPDEAALQRLKSLQIQYFSALTAGTYDDAYGEDRERVGLAHARIGLPPGWYLGAYSHYLTELLPKLSQMPDLGEERRTETLQALIKVVFLDMGLAIDSYITLRDSLIAGLRDYGAVFAHLPYATVVITTELEAVFANQAFAHLVGCKPDSISGRQLSTLMELGDLPALVAQAQKHGYAKGATQLRPHVQALAVPATITVQILGLEGNEQQSRLLITVEDLRENEQLTRDLLNAQEVANIGTWHSHFDGRLALTPQAARIFGWNVGQPLRYDELLECVHPDDRSFASAKWQEGIVNGHHAFSMRVLNGDDVRRVEMRGKVEHDANGRPVRGYGTVLDITERHNTEQRMRRLAYFDTLTGLPNRRWGMKLVQRLLNEAGKQGTSAVVIFADLDKFKEINDSQGHAMGDRVLEAVARNCENVLNKGSVLARLGGDEFMFAHAVANQDEAMAVAQQLLTVLEYPITIDGLRFELHASIGVALYPAHGRNVDDLLQCADIAMYRAKLQGGGSLLYDDKLGQQVQRSILLSTRLEEALQQSLLEQHYQPKVTLVSGKLCGVEALARWHDSELGWVSPAEFIPVAEERGLITVLGDWCLGAAARQWRAWRNAGVKEPPVIAVNVSAEQMMNDAFPERAQALLRAHGVPTCAIEFEITESVLMHNPSKAQRIASRLVEQGFELSIDDFGTGYSSLARLHDFPISRLKIDMSFVRGMFADNGGLAIVTAVIGMSRALGLSTVAEGVETQEQRQKLCELQCDEAQGYLFSKALPAAELERLWLRRSTCAPTCEE